MSQEFIHRVTNQSGNPRFFMAIVIVIAIACTSFEMRAMARALDAPCTAVDFHQLLAKSAWYKGKRICVVGVAEVDGISFTLFQPPQRELHRRIAVDRKHGRPRYEQLNNRWVKIVGRVSEDPEKIFGCRLLLESVEALARPLVKGIKTYGIFFNEGPDTIRVDVVNKPRNERTTMTLSPSDVLKTVIVEGTAKVSRPSTNAFPGPALSECTVPNEKSALDCFEESTRTFYFRVRDGRIALVRPREALAAKKRWEEIEKINNSE
jgi:hypothetical protein